MSITRFPNIDIPVVSVIWGYTGLLSLGQSLFFALGGYAFGMYLMRQIGHDGTYHSGPIALQWGGGIVKWRKVQVRPIIH